MDDNENKQEPQEHKLDTLVFDAFHTFLQAYSPVRTNDRQQELHRSTQEVCNILADTCDVSKVVMADLLQGAEFKLCIDHDGRVKWKIFKNVIFDADEDDDFV